MLDLPAISSRLKVTLRMPLAGLMVVVLLAASVLPATAHAEDSFEQTIMTLGDEPDSPEGQMAKLLHSCAHCQSHHLATLGTSVPALSAFAFVLTVWPMRVEHRESMRATPPPPPPRS